MDPNERRSRTLAQIAEAIAAEARVRALLTPRKMTTFRLRYSDDGSITRKASEGNNVARALLRLKSNPKHTTKQIKKASTRHPERNSPSSLIKMYLATSCKSLITQRLYRWLGLVSMLTARIS